MSTRDTATHLLALATAIVALGAVFWLVRERDRRDMKAVALSDRALG
jgi:hypothetical protein